jgi:hypothetical protein
MIAPPPILDLDDAASLEAADTPGVLRSAATGGAQVRATAAAVAEDVLSRLVGLRPRSVVIVAGSGRAYRAAALLSAAVGGHAGIPIVIADTTPPWAGPLDVLVVAGDDAGDPRLAEAVDRGVRRGAEVVVATPDEGPVRAAAAGRAIVLPPRVPVLGQNTLLRHLSVGMAVLGVVDPAHSGRLLPELGRLADALDAEAVVDQPRNEVFHNPAKALAARMQGHRLVLTGDTPATTELAEHAAEVLLRVAGRVTVALTLSEVVAAAPELRAGPTTSGAAYDPLFHDEELDGPAPRDPIRVFALTTDPDPRAAQRRIAMLPDADIVTAAVDADEAASRPAGASEPGELEQLAVLAVRLELAAAYVKLTGGGLS